MQGISASKGINPSKQIGPLWHLANQVEISMEQMSHRSSDKGKISRRWLEDTGSELISPGTQSAPGFNHPKNAHFANP